MSLGLKLQKKTTEQDLKNPSKQMQGPVSPTNENSETKITPTIYSTIKY